MKIFNRAMCKWRGYFIGILLISIVLLIPPAESSAATINIDAGKTTGINPLIYGNNMEVSSDTGNGAWDPTSYQSVPAVVDFAKDAGITILRFPGGNFAKEYHWLDGIGPYAARPTRTYGGWATVNNKYGTDEHMAFSGDIGAEVMITVNAVTGSPEEAAAWVAYLNGSPNDTNSIGGGWGTVGDWAGLRADPDYANHPNSFNVRYWEIDNEIWDDYDVTEYIGVFEEFYTAMKAVDPDIKVGAVSKWNYDWPKTLIEGIGADVDFLILHYYMPFVRSYSQADVDAILADINESFKATLAVPTQIQYQYTRIRNMIESSPASASRAQDIELLITEYNTGFYSDINDTVRDYQYSLGSALQNAESLNLLMNPDNKIGAANIWNFKSNVYGQVKGENPYTVRPTHYVFTMYKDYFGPELVNTTVTSDTYDSSKVLNTWAITSYRTDADDAKFRIRLQRDAGTNIAGDVWYDDIVVRESSSDTNLLLNPGFESNDANWSHSADPTDVNSSVDSSSSRSGSKSFKLSFAGGSNPAYDGMYQDVNIVPNTRYEISGYIKTQGITVDPVNLLLNPGFESNFTSWTSSSPTGATTSIDPAVSHSGTKSARVDFSGGYDVNYYHVRQTRNVDPSLTYIVEGYIKTDNITSNKGVRLGWEDDIGNNGFTGQLTGTNGWTYVAARVKPGGSQITVRLRRLDGGGSEPISGTAWWDDIRIQPLPKTYSPNIEIDVINDNNTIDETLTLDGLLGTHDWVQKKTNGTPYLSATASKDGNNLYLMVVNKNLDSNVPATINISGFSLPPDTSALTLNGPSIDATNESGDLVKVTSSTISNASTSFEYTFPAHSLTAIGFGRTAPPVPLEPPPSPMAHWKMDELSWSGAGAVVDSSGYGNNGTAAGDATTVAPGAPYGNGPRAGTFDGNGDHVTVSDSASITFKNKQNFSIAFWINPNELDGIFQDLVSKSGSSSYRVMMAWDNKVKISLIQPNFTAYDSGHIPTLNTWEHIALVVDFTTLEVRWYLNGSPLATNALTNSDMADPGGALVIADMTTGGNERPYDGLLDDVRIYNVALTSEQVARICNRADINGDGSIDWLDVEVLSEQWLDTIEYLDADINGDTSVDFEDFAELANVW
ncbi:MAG TPA: hypothetical protein ENH34_04080 [Phycisphaerales bacterium]|nr:hypothetical protein [Phycisphaerales bacterium]